MKPLARRTDALSQSDIRAITKMVNAVQGINLGQGICDLPTPEPIKIGAQQAIADNRSIYTNYAGIQRLRTAILEKTRTYNRIPANSDAEVMVSVGSTGAFVASIFALLEPGAEVILFEPFYGYHRNLLDLVGVDIKYISTQPPDWSIDFGTLEQAVFDVEAHDRHFFEGETLRYFSNIIGKFSSMVQKALTKIRPLPLNIIAPAHGLSGAVSLSG